VTSLPRAEQVLDRARAGNAFSAATADVGDANAAMWQYAAGRLGFESDTRVNIDTVFDVASLTKVLATTTLAVDLSVRGRLDVERPVNAYLADWSTPDRAGVTVRDLLEHTSGLPAYREYFRTLSGRDEFLRAIAAEPLEYAPRSASTYSDLGFMLLGFILEDVGGAPLDRQFAGWRAREGLSAPLMYRPPPEWRARTALTEHDSWRGRVLQGEVHDENAAALGGVAAHAGLFGTAAAVGEVARWWLANVDTPAVRAFVRKTTVSGSSRAMGWDTMLPTSSCGARLSSRAFGHTGFTGTSLWIDPDRNAYIVLLTNRVHPTRRNDGITAVRREFHDAVALDLDLLASESHA
jgi:CubicO group peptidase (beta-lactamase class C family)